MKGIQGLIVAVVLGLVGAAANFYYLNTEAQKKDMVAFIGIKKGVILGRGDKLSEDKLVKVEIPANQVGNLKDYACDWKELVGVKDRPVWRTLSSGDSEGARLLLKDDYRMPQPELELAKGETGQFIAVPKTFDTALINPGARIQFKVATMAPPAPTPAPKPAAPVPGAAATGAAGTTGASPPEPEPEDRDAARLNAGPFDTLGPFVVLAIGNRLGRLDVMKASKGTPTQQNVLLIRISKNVPGEEKAFEKLDNYIHHLGPNCYEIQLLPKE